MATFSTLIRPVTACVAQTQGTPPAYEYTPIATIRPKYRVVLAGKCFFHIEETTTGRVRGFRTDHNEACYLARTLEQSTSMAGAMT
ncbi:MULTISPECIES: hypothetical protein [Pseudomonas]|jgi:hypothetical protein|uniref:hypothetical protein n=1 Tax=Pseudomonas TaxID=286 RepID=UPI0005DB463C|nr:MULTISPECIES: hypothetical protein [Pseudomonas]KJH86638.1 hypothetical protein UG46_11290 [Pseudomonas fluorescens]WRV70454.1 hypothetical protein VQ575_10570 [Pseudomonas frederiksbergensis]